ncbi:zinc transporter ZIP10 [Erpetoichthys calabaricus]|uniref:zinc transporter ZIP10 n=1 Tax=Erpetoichthys calabaricus TaxID=27687 RepID=UPI00109F5F40|nr:zinc transporter ZIP10 [Erpetoichthys calabaricus]
MEVHPGVWLIALLLHLKIWGSTGVTGPETNSVGSQAPETSRGDLEEALQEQGYYLHQLFLQYGNNGTLSFEGLHRLLASLGLGAVNVLEIHHESVGHDHVSHLDALELQEGKHSHSHPAEEHKKQMVKEPTLRGSTPAPGLDREKPTMDPHQVRGRAAGHLSEGPRLSHPLVNHLHENCLNVSQLLENFGLGEENAITPGEFTFLCPALLYQIDSRVCIRHNDEVKSRPADGAASLLIALTWGSLAVTVISVPPLLAIVLVPLLRRRILETLLAFLVALAVGTLCGDALLHLLPHAQAGGHSGGDLDLEDSVLKGLCVLAGIYILFAIECLMGLIRSCRQRPGPPAQEQGHSPGPPEGLELMESRGSPGPRTGSGTWGDGTHGHSHGSSMVSLAWMVMVGDGVHNLTDGLAIGAAFSLSVSGGLSTAIAVFCHELPHELGDLAMLLHAGLSWRRALLFNLVSALLSFVGMLAGVFIASHSSGFTLWVFSATAGVFLYVALVNMAPEMLHGKFSTKGTHWNVVLQLLGLLCGGTIMLFIALFEEKLVLNW